MAILSTSYAVESGVKTTLKNTISPTTTTGIKLNYALTITSGVLRFDPDTSREEYISFGGATVLSGVTTLSDVVRNLSKTLNNFSGSGTGFQHSGGACNVELTNYHTLYNLKANTDRANTWLADQTIASGVKLYFGNANQWIYSNGTELYLRSSLQAERSLSQLASLSGVNDKVKNSVNDTTEGYLSTKLTATSGSGLTLTTVTPAGNETLNVAIQLELSNPTLQISSNQLGIKIKAAGGLASDASGTYVDTSALTGVIAASLGGNLTYNASITAKDALAWVGNQRVDKTDANAVNTAFLFAGVANATGVQGDSKQVIQPGPVVTVNAFSLTDRQDCRLWTGQTQGVSNTTTDTIATTAEWRSQTWTPGVGEDNVSTITLNFTKASSPNGSSTVAIYATSGGLPTGAALGTATTILNSAITSGDNTFSFTTPVAVTPGTVYAIVWSSGISSGGTLAWNYQNTNVYASGQRCTSSNSGSSWTADANSDFRFTVNYRGIAGEPVYIGNTAGALVLTPGTYPSRVGYALSTTQVVITESQKAIYGTFSGSYLTSDNVTTVVTIGFRARCVYYQWSSAMNGSVWGVVASNGYATLATAQHAGQGTGPTTMYPVDKIIDGTLINKDNSNNPFATFQGILSAINADSLSFNRVVGASGTVGTHTCKFVAFN